ncbi:AAA family ATPase [Rothia koreensis]|uniref:AAA family ATPase n=1 Tax=Rothia koreensis TaxID=592378 RepID=UPI001390C979|nr:AAA family ATPase [Rothia koreensis]
MNTYDEARTELRVTYAHMIQPHRQRWLWAHDGAGVIPLGTGTIAAGIGGEGKSTFMLDLAAQLTQGTLPGDLYGSKENVIIFGPEDDWPTVMVPRLMAAGADLSRVAQVQAATITESFTRERELIFPVDLGLLREAVKETGARMVIIDPAPNLMDGDMNKVQDVRRSYGPLMALAQEHDLAIILINHFGKGAGNVGAKLSGSHAWRDLTRSYLAFASDPETGERILTQDKNNYGTGRGSWKFVLESVDVPTEDGNTNVGKVRFLGASEVTVGELINRDSLAEEDQEDRNAAQQFVYDFLVNTEAQEAKAGAVIKAGLAEGFSTNEIKDARRRSKSPRILSVKSSFGAGWVWQIDPEGGTESSQGGEGGEGGSTYEVVPPSTSDTQGGTKVACTQEVPPSPPSVETVPPSSTEPGTHEPPEGVTRTPQGVEGVKDVSAQEQVTPSKVSPEGVTKVSCTQNVTPSTPSGETVTPSSGPVTCTKMDCTRDAATGHEWCQHHIDLRQRRLDVEAKRQGDAA